MRVLYYVPITSHSIEELGSLAAPFLKAKRCYRQIEKEKYIRKVKEYWANISQQIFQVVEKNINTPEKIHIYMDGLPAIENCHLMAVVKELIAQKLPQYLIVQELIEKGGIIHGTESLKLLLEEHEMFKI